ncbi:uncharacterized protein LOC132641152 isoform X2 [Lycium barbarum]|uniref:uncharacterized protein LOC132641152 isoform X2 n=1 Tax=Lycium barbarum TaxID=112863 RepID=UPI00293E483C|nr:uncharacterized protein LOC132641152 isoform X2 [Lycium barbarum]XP_060214025.1 uncharacterized protein LOC132641152 isoform X2 [Lycium barbarum]
MAPQISLIWRKGSTYQTCSHGPEHSHFCCYTPTKSWCLNNGFNLILGETDSLLLQNCITNQWTSPWKIEETVKKIKQLMIDNGVITRHCFREANEVADKLATQGHRSNENCIYTTLLLYQGKSKAF